MVSFRKFFSIGIMMAVLLFLFQFSLVIKERGNRYDVNEFFSEERLSQENSWQSDVTGLQNETAETNNSIVYIGSENETIQKMVEQWCLYTKRDLLVYPSVASYAAKQSGRPEAVLLDGEPVKRTSEIARISEMAEQGIPLVFCTLPDVSVIRESETLMTLLGIGTVAAEQTTLRGIQLYEGFLLGGEAIYEVKEEADERRQDLSLEIPWYILSSGTKLYMVGLPENELVKNEYMPALIWRNSQDQAKIFAVNGSYMEDSTGMGILSAMMAELHSYELYPVVNAQLMSVANYPGFAAENTAVMQEIYARNLDGVFRDLMWPGLSSSAEKGKFRMTCFLTPQMDYADAIEPTSTEFVFYLKQLKEANGEAGLSMDYWAGEQKEAFSLSEKMVRDGWFFDATGSEYRYGAVYVRPEDLETYIESDRTGVYENTFTVISDSLSDYPVISYISEDTTLQSVTSDGFGHTFSQDLRMKGLETALGYSNILLDLKRVAWPTAENESWEILYENFSSNINTYWQSFESYEKTTASEGDRRIRNFLALDFSHSRNGNMISLQVKERTEEAWFLLRTHSEAVTGMEGGSYSRLEEDVYLIQAERDIVTIFLEEVGAVYQFEDEER
ncbi:MAG: DUF2194 domain-containing protein [Lachnospiraceae bacterium]|nr:DUF2194 domain-containing protein [Lachnospiraceae bacterium]